MKFYPARLTYLRFSYLVNKCVQNGRLQYFGLQTTQRKKCRWRYISFNKVSEMSQVPSTSRHDSPVNQRWKRRTYEVENMPPDKTLYLKQTAPVKHASVATVVCPNCYTEVKLEDMEEPMVKTRTIITKVYHFLEREYLALMEKFGDLDLSPLLKLRARTAEATGVSESMVCEILKKEQDINKISPQIKWASKRKRDQGVPVREDRSQDTSEEDTSTDESDDDDTRAEDKIQEHAEPEIETVEIKVEPPDDETITEQAEPEIQTVEIKIEALDDETYTETSETATQRVREYRARQKMHQTSQQSTENQQSATSLVKTSADRGREYRARRKMCHTSGSSTGDQQSVTNQSKTPAQRSREYRERRKRRQEFVTESPQSSKQNFLLIDAGKIIMRPAVNEPPEEYTFHESDKEQDIKNQVDIKIEEVELTEEEFT